MADKGFANYVKIAVAVAVIKGKPTQLSSRQYAEQICATYKVTQLDWKTKAGKLRDKVMLLNQKLLHLNAGPIEGTEEGNIASAKLISDNVREKSKDGTTDLILVETGSGCPTNLYNLILTLKSCKKNLEAIGNSYSCEENVVNLKVLVKETFCAVLDSLDVSIVEPGIQKDHFFLAIDEITKILGSDLNSDDVMFVRENVDLFLKRVVLKLLDIDGYRNNVDHNWVKNLVCYCGSSSSLKISTSYAIIHGITNLLERMRLSDNQMRYPVLLENVGALVVCLKKIIDSYDGHNIKEYISQTLLLKGNRTPVILSLEDRNNMADILEGSLTQVWEDSPLLANLVWNICSSLRMK